MRGNIFSCTRGYLKVGNGSPSTVIQEEGVWGLPPAWAGTRDRIIYTVTVTALHPFNTTPPPLPPPLLGWSAAGSVAPGHVTPCRWSPGRCPETSHHLLRTTRQSQVNRRHHGRRPGLSPASKEPINRGNISQSGSQVNPNLTQVQVKVRDHFRNCEHAQQDSASQGNRFERSSWGKADKLSKRFDVSVTTKVTLTVPAPVIKSAPLK